MKAIKTALSGRVTESVGETGKVWRVVVIEAGLSLNKVNYPVDLLRESASMFDRARVFVKSDREHSAGEGKSFSKIVGMLQSPEFIEDGQGGRIEAEFHVLESAGPVAPMLKEMYERGMTDVFGFSIDVTALADTAVSGIREAKKFLRVHSLDLIVEPGAGGRLINLIESYNFEEENSMTLNEELQARLKEAVGHLPGDIDLNDNKALMAAIVKADSAPPASNTDEIIRATEARMKEVEDAAKDRIRLAEANASARSMIAEAELPTEAKEKLKAAWVDNPALTIELVTEAVKGEVNMFAKLHESGIITGVGGVSLSEDQRDKTSTMFDDFFDPGKFDVYSIKECYIQSTGDARVTGRLDDCSAAKLRENFGMYGQHRLTEAVSAGTFGQMLRDSMNKRALIEYSAESAYDDWAKVVDAVAVSDYRTQYRPIIGGYANFPVVAENAAYLAMTSPTDDEATYSVDKRGGLETISIEAIKNDESGALARTPQRLAIAAKRTLYDFVMGFFVTNAALYDAVAWFHGTHNNLGSAALSAASISAARLAMMNQTERDSGKKAPVPPSILLVPFELESTAYDILNQRGTNQDQSFLQRHGIEVVPVPTWTDVNDWVLMADPRVYPCIEIGFLDNVREPSILLQDNPTSGSVFSNDQLTFKLNHTYSGVVTAYQPAYKAVVV